MDFADEAIAPVLFAEVLFGVAPFPVALFVEAVFSVFFVDADLALVEVGGAAVAPVGLPPELVVLAAADDDILDFADVFEPAAPTVDCLAGLWPRVQ